ncbi:mycofactocin system FadH/OYE family oxidoreductase 1 [Rhodococcus sp. 27YEA15]
MTEVASVLGNDWPYERAPLASECGPGWRAIAAACAPHGTLVLAGLGHTGMQGSSAWSQSVLWGPSRVADPVTRELPVEMEQSEIDELVDGFRASAALAVASGVDGVELDAGSRSILRQYLSGLTNTRSDRYGTDRATLLGEVIDAVRAAVGPDHVVSLRLSCDEEAPWAGITPELAAGYASEFATALDLLVVVRGGLYSSSRYRPDFHEEPNFNSDLCRTVGDAVSGQVPVVLQGSVVSALAADAALASGVADLVEMTRAQIADPDLVSKVRAGQAPRPCVLCNQTCLVLDPRNPVVTCVGNPGAGFETEDPDERDLPPLIGSAVVVGGGPAGLEAARILAGRGMSVTVKERSAQVGGMINTFAVGRGRSRFGLLARWLEDECRTAGVRIRTGVESQSECSSELVVLATGSAARPPTYPVDGSVRWSDASEALTQSGAWTGRMVLVDPLGGPIAVALAESLVRAGNEISIVTPDAIVGSRLGSSGDLVGANARIQRAGIARICSSLIVEVSAGQVIVENMYTGATSSIGCDYVIDCSPRLPDLEAADSAGIRVGDMIAPRTTLESIREGRLAGSTAGTSSKSAERAAP